MKRISLAMLAVVLVFGLAFVSCGDKEGNVSGGGGVSGYGTVRVYNDAASSGTQVSVAIYTLQYNSPAVASGHAARGSYWAYSRLDPNTSYRVSMLSTAGEAIGYGSFKVAAGKVLNLSYTGTAIRVK